jgi:hypothetical protein
MTGLIDQEVVLGLGGPGVGWVRRDRRIICLIKDGVDGYTLM